MFNKKVEVEKSTKKFNSDAAVTILTKGCSFNGKLHCKGSTRIAGDVEGQILSEGLLVVEEGAQIDADIHAEEVVIHGRVKGSIFSKGRVALAPTCYIEGNIVSPALVIAEGAHFVGSCDMHGKTTEDSKKRIQEPINLKVKTDATTDKQNDVKIAARKVETPA